MHVKTNLFSAENRRKKKNPAEKGKVCTTNFSRGQNVILYIFRYIIYINKITIRSLPFRVRSRPIRDFFVPPADVHKIMI